MRAWAVWASAVALFGVSLGDPSVAWADEPSSAKDTAEPAEKPAPPEAKRPARPPLPPAPETKPLPWQHHLDIGPLFALVARPASHDDKGQPSAVRYAPGFGVGVGLRLPVHRNLDVAGYFVDSQHVVELPPGALGVAGTIESPRVHAFSFGARVAPALSLGPRTRAWLSAGAGWGRLEFDRMKATEPLGAFTIRERSMSFVEISLGLGASFEVIPRWLRVQLEVTGAFVPSQVGSAIERAQAIDAAGKKRTILGLPKLDGVITPSLGLMLLL